MYKIIDAINLFVPQIRARALYSGHLVPPPIIANAVTEHSAITVDRGITVLSCRSIMIAEAQQKYPFG